MPFVKAHTKADGTKVKAHYRLNSVWNFWFGFGLLIMWLAIARNR